MNCPFLHSFLHFNLSFPSPTKSYSNLSFILYPQVQRAVLRTENTCPKYHYLCIWGTESNQYFLILVEFQNYMENIFKCQCLKTTGPKILDYVTWTALRPVLAQKFTYTHSYTSLVDSNVLCIEGCGPLL